LLERSEFAGGRSEEARPLRQCLLEQLGQALGRAKVAALSETESRRRQLRSGAELPNAVTVPIG